MLRLMYEARETPAMGACPASRDEGGDVWEELEAGDVNLAINVDCERAQFDALGPARGAVLVVVQYLGRNVTF